MSILLRDSEIEMMLLWYHSHETHNVTTMAEDDLAKKLEMLRGEALAHGRNRIFYAVRADDDESKTDKTD